MNDTRQTTRKPNWNGVTYDGYDGSDSNHGRNHFSAPTGYADGIPYNQARLIAAAPALLEALEAVMMHVDDEGCGLCLCHPCASYCPGQQARAAIAQAKGEA